MNITDVKGLLEKIKECEPFNGFQWFSIDNQTISTHEIDSSVNEIFKYVNNGNLSGMRYLKKALCLNILGDILTEGHNDTQLVSDIVKLVIKNEVVNNDSFKQTRFSVPGVMDEPSFIGITFETSDINSIYGIIDTLKIFDPIMSRYWVRIFDKGHFAWDKHLYHLMDSDLYRLHISLNGEGSEIGNVKPGQTLVVTYETNNLEYARGIGGTDGIRFCEY